MVPTGSAVAQSGLGRAGLGAPGGGNDGTCWLGRARLGEKQSSARGGRR